MQNKSIDEIREFYSHYPNPSCTKINPRSQSFLSEDSDFSNNGFVGNIKKIFRKPQVDEGECQKWIYNRDFGYESMTSELNWVCQNAWKSAFGQSTFFIGSVIGTLVFGIFADIVGRIPVLIYAHLMGIIGNGLTIFSTDIVTFSICRFISGFATDSNFVMMYILGESIILNLLQNVTNNYLFDIPLFMNIIRP